MIERIILIKISFKKMLSTRASVIFVVLRADGIPFCRLRIPALPPPPLNTLVTQRTEIGAVLCTNLIAQFGCRKSISATKVDQYPVTEVRENVRPCGGGGGGGGGNSRGRGELNVWVRLFFSIIHILFRKHLANYNQDVNEMVGFLSLTLAVTTN